MDLFDLYAALTLDTDAYERGLDTAESDAGAAAKRIEDTLADGLGGAGKRMASGVSSGARAVTSSLSGVGSAATSAGRGIVNAMGSAARGMVTAFSAAAKTTATAIRGIATVAGDVATTTINAVEGAAKAVSTVGVAALGTASAATVALGKTALDAYGEFEQLAGGIDTLFGEGSAAAQAVKGFAANAFQTAQMSANEYMQTVTDFSATLMQTLSADDAALKADKAIQQMADNANKMGSSMESVEYAYKGLAKQNATMLDNLKLGYGGNNSELARLINDSGVLGDVQVTEKDVFDRASFADIIDAIGVIQERLGMAGVSQEEALHTIQGSINMTKAAWENLVTGFADPDADLGVLMDNLTTSLDAVTENVAPAVERILASLSEAVTEGAPRLATRITNLINSLAPDLTRSAVALLQSVVRVLADTAPGLLDNGLATLLDTLEDETTGLETDAVRLIAGIVETIGKYAPRLISTLGKTLRSVLRAAVQRMGESPQETARTISDIILSILDGLTGLAEEAAPLVEDVIPRIIAALTSPENLARLGNAGLRLVRAIADGIIGGGASLIETALGAVANVNVDGVITSITGAFDGILDGVSIGTPDTSGVGGILDDVSMGTPDTGTPDTSGIFGAFDAISGILDNVSMGTPGTGGVGGVLTGIENAYRNTLDNVRGMLEGFDAEGAGATFASVGTRIIASLTTGLAEAVGTVAPSIAEFVNGIAAAFSDESNVQALADAGRGMLDSILAFTDTLDGGEIANAGVNIVTTLANSLGEALPEVVGTIGEFVSEFATALTSEENIEKMKGAGNALFDGLCAAMNIDSGDEDAGLGEKVQTAAQSFIDTYGRDIRDGTAGLAETATSVIGDLARFLTDPDTLQPIEDTGTTITKGLGEGLDKGISDFIAKDLPTIAGNLISGVLSLVPRLFYGICDVILGIGGGIGDGLSRLYHSSLASDAERALNDPTLTDEERDEWQSIRDNAASYASGEKSLMDEWWRNDYEDRRDINTWAWDDAFVDPIRDAVREQAESDARWVNGTSQTDLGSMDATINVNATVPVMLDGDQIGQAATTYQDRVRMQRGY